LGLLLVLGLLRGRDHAERELRLGALDVTERELVRVREDRLRGLCRGLRLTGALVTHGVREGACVGERVLRREREERQEGRGEAGSDELLAGPPLPRAEHDLREEAQESERERPLIAVVGHAPLAALDLAPLELRDARAVEVLERRRRLLGREELAARARGQRRQARAPELADDLVALRVAQERGSALLVHHGDLAAGLGADADHEHADAALLRLLRLGRGLAL